MHVVFKVKYTPDQPTPTYFGDAGFLFFKGVLNFIYTKQNIWQMIINAFLGFIRFVEL